jgi:hypothetical protein
VEKGLDFLFIYFFLWRFYIVSNYQWEQKKIHGFKLASIVLSWVNIHSIRLMTGSSNSYCPLLAEYCKNFATGSEGRLVLDV